VQTPAQEDQQVQEWGFWFARLSLWGVVCLGAQEGHLKGPLGTEIHIGNFQSARLQNRPACTKIQKEVGGRA
jgi:hypothetical protein